MLCHTDTDLSMERNGRTVSLYVSHQQFTNSIHSEMDCIDCHEDFDPEDLPHREGEDIYKVDCSLCHPGEVERFEISLHAEALRRGARLAPDCAGCHTKHYIRSKENPSSPTFVMNIPMLCGKCHKEGTEVQQLQTVSQHNILEHYSQSIHGDGLFRRGLVVTAVCTSCHNSHEILKHEDPNSSINPRNVPATCMKCHAQIELVHTKIIEGELWEEKPHVIPNCIDCHQPHEVRRRTEESFADDVCMECHGDVNLTRTVDGITQSLFVDITKLDSSAHNESSCVRCHTNVSRTESPVCLDSGPVDCTSCHSQEGLDYQISSHGTAWASKDPNSPYCTDCHGEHEILPKSDQQSPTFSKNIATLCGECHAAGAPVNPNPENTIVEDYTNSIHGQGLFESGLVVTATCASCHTAHRQLPNTSEQSSTNKHNLPVTCAQCHLGIYEEFRKSVHSEHYSDTEEKLPACDDCHGAHEITVVRYSDFRTVIMQQCGGCHEDLTKSYFDTHHGKLSQLGSAAAAKCSDCHGAHNILPPSDPHSTLSRENVVETCAYCHPSANDMFVGYLTHATHHDQEKYPFLFYTFWFMTALLIGTFTFFGLHTLLWLPRSFKEKKKHKALMARIEEEEKASPGKKTRYQRFDKYSRILHIMVIISFISLAVTGMTIKFADVPIFQVVSHILGGVEVSKFIHRVAAIITFAYFFLHIWYLFKKWRKSGVGFFKYFLGPDSMVPRWKDAKELLATFKWFVGAGPRPEYGRWTYWEKFDYLAVFWGVAVIGLSGLVLWFPEFFTALGVPGAVINIATIIHSDEALLATGFIFTVHFFNTHFRPDKFPMDRVIFTGSIPVDELKIDRPAEYELLKKRGTLEENLVEAPSPWLLKISRIFGFAALITGILLIILIIVSMLVFYQ